MDASFWLERWQQRQIGFHQQEINSHLLAHWPSLSVASKRAAFVPLCGKSRDMQWLHSRGHTVIGIELARTAIEEYFDEIGVAPTVRSDDRFEISEAPGYRLLCGDFFRLEARDLNEIGGVFDRAALVALPADMRKRYADRMLQIVPANAPMLLIAVDYDQAQMKGPPFSVNETEVRSLFAGRSIEKLSDASILDFPENIRFKERGLSRLTEQVYRVANP